LRRVLLATFGSAGDLLPLLPIASQLQDEGHEVRLVVPRALGLYLRTARVRFESFSVGDGSEMSFTRDKEIFTTRFFGWASWRRTFVHYLAPTLEANVAEVRDVIRRWQPDVVATMTFATAARIAALIESVPHVSCSIYPQFLDYPRPGGGAFARAFLREVQSVCPPDMLKRYGLDLIAWGRDPSGVLLHDPLLLGVDAMPPGLHVTGYTYEDALAGKPSDEEAALEWLERSADAVLVTLGSFVGFADSEVWAHAVQAARACGVRALFVNARTAVSDKDDVLAVGYVPLSRIADRALAVVHHGGIGTTFGVLRAGRPAVVLPQAFDQPFNARLIANMGAGTAASAPALADALNTVLSSTPMRECARAAAERLVSPTTAAMSSASSILAAGFR
jgi:rhamnosyltransferase subunit B